MILKAIFGALRNTTANAVVLVAALLAFMVLPVADAFACGGETLAPASDTGASGMVPDHDGEGREADQHSCPHGHGHHASAQPPHDEEGSPAYCRSASRSGVPGENRRDGQPPNALDHPPKVIGQA